MDTKTRHTYMLPTRDPPQTKRHKQTESKRMEKDIPCEWKPKESQRAILISEKIDFKINNIIRDKEGHYIMIRGSTQEDITIVFMHLTEEHLNT